MKVKFSPSTGSFYPQDMIDDGSYDNNLPNDLADVTEKEIVTYWKKSAPLGKKLGSCDGRPCWVDLPPPSEELLFYINTNKKNRQKLLAESEIAWRQYAVEGSYAKDSEVKELLDWKKYLVLLMRIDLSKTNNIKWPLAPNK